MSAAPAKMRFLAVAGATALATGIGIAPAIASPTGSPQMQVVASGLNNPRQLTFAPTGALFVAESGTGGSGPCFVASAGSRVCYGTTGSITEISHGHQRRVLTGLPSLAEAGGAQAAGPADITMTGSQKYVIAMGLGAGPAQRAQLLPRNGQVLGTLIQGKMKHGSWSILADVAANEAANNPDKGQLDTNPAAVVRQGSRYLVADAGGNDVVQATHKGAFSTVAVFPTKMVTNPFGPPGTTVPMQAVPTSVAIGPDGAKYVSQLTGFPFPVGKAIIYRVVPGHAPAKYATGLTNVTDLAFAPDGTLYAVEIATKGLTGSPIGSVVRIPAGGGTPTTVVGGLFAPYGIALHHGSAYVTTYSVAAHAGQVLRIPLG